MINILMIHMVAQGGTDDLNLCRGHVYWQGGNSFAGPGQGDRQSIAHGRNNDLYQVCWINK